VCAAVVCWPFGTELRYPEAIVALTSTHRRGESCAVLRRTAQESPPQHLFILTISHVLAGISRDVVPYLGPGTARVSVPGFS
jgi:hypothetical protein